MIASVGLWVLWWIRYTSRNVLCYTLVKIVGCSKGSFLVVFQKMYSSLPLRHDFQSVLHDAFQSGGMPKEEENDAEDREADGKDDV